MRKHLASYRVDPDLLAAVTAKAAECGETVTEVVERGFRVYVQGGEVPPVAQWSPVAASFVCTAVDVAPDYEEAPEEEAPEEEACDHPAAAMEGTYCKACRRDVD